LRDQLADLGIQRLALRLFLALAVQFLVAGGLGFGLLLRRGFLRRRTVTLGPRLMLLPLVLLALYLPLGILHLLLVDEPGLEQLLAQRK